MTDKRKPKHPTTASAALPEEATRTPNALATAGTPAPPALGVDPEFDRIAAREVSGSAIGALRVVLAADPTTDIAGLIDLLTQSSVDLRGKDVSRSEDMLMHQAIALQSLFVRLTEDALKTTNVQHRDLHLRYALRSQGQCRSTIESLAAIKNPPTIFAKQTNVTTGSQQVNNGTINHGTALYAARGNTEPEQNELSGEPSELWPDARTPSLARGTDSPLAPMGEVIRPSVAAGQGMLVAQRVERRDESHASRTAARTAAPRRRTRPTVS